MAEKNITEKQREILARKLGYEGPMHMFDEFVRSDEAMSRKYNTVVQKYMARGGAVKKFAEGGAAFDPATYDVGEGFGMKKLDELTAQGATRQQIIDVAKRAPVVGGRVKELIPELADPAYGTSWGAGSEVDLSRIPVNFDWRAYVEANPDLQAAGIDTAIEAQRHYAMYGAAEGRAGATKELEKPAAPSVAAQTIQLTPEQMVQTQLAPEQAAGIAPVTPIGAAGVAPVTPTAAATMEAAKATEGVSAEVEKLQPAVGVVNDEALVKAAQAVPEESLVGQLNAAELEGARKVEGAPVRGVLEQEMVSGPAVDRAAVEATLAQAEAAQGVVTEEMTIQGQLNKLITDFEVNNPPAWAAASLRNATATLSARGLAASSLAGQAIIQATLEAATPIAAQDAQVFRDMGIQNLSNRQQTAILVAQQRAAFLGQEFDQTFQTRVLNAAKISDVANLNFNAQQQIAIENSRMAQSVDLANLSNQQAMVMAEAAQIANLETANLNNRQQAAVNNAQAFLQVDMANLQYEQQTSLFKAQAVTNALFTDTAAENAARQFNASSENQVNQFFASLDTQVRQFNATQVNAINQFNADQGLAISRFNADSQNQRDQFNAANRLVIDQSNAQWRRSVATADTATINRVNEVNAANALTLTTIEYNNQWQTYRDAIEYAWKAGQNESDRLATLARQQLANDATITAAALARDGANAAAIGQATAAVLGNTGVSLGDVWDFGVEAVDFVVGLF